MDIGALLKTHRDEILAIAQQHGASNVRVFGSVARGEAGPDSDVDILVDLELGRSLFDHAQLQIDLEALLGRKVDVVTARGLRPHLRDRVLQEATVRNVTERASRISLVPSAHHAFDAARTLCSPTGRGRIGRILRDTLMKLLELPATERIDLAMALWDRLTPAEQEAEFDLTPEQRAELDRRLAEHIADPASAVPWEEVRRKLIRGA